MIEQLNCRLKELEFTSDAPFEGDVLNRKSNAEILTSVIDTYSSTGCVLAINGAWGTGKTTFVRMWKAYLESLQYPTLFFNAWTSDYMDDPLVALLSELKTLNPDDKSMKQAISNVGRIFLASASSIIKRHVGIPDEIIDEIKQIGAKSLEEYSEYQRTFKEFKSSLRSFVADNASEKPVVFFIDELDRCRPDYAVKVLERIKHLFDIPNVIFVLSINKTQLGYAIQGYYGTDRMDTDDYLRRFIDHEYSLPQPDSNAFVNYLYGQYDFDSFLHSTERLQYYRKGTESKELLDTANQLTKLCKLDLRTLDRVFSLCRITLQAMKPNNYLLPDVTFILCLLKVKYSSIYEKIQTQVYSVQELLDSLETSLFSEYKPDKRKSFDHLIEYAVGVLIVNYQNPLHGSIVDKTFVGKEIEGSNNKEYPFEVKYLQKDKLNEAINWCVDNGREQYHMGLKFTMDRISMLASINKQF